MPTFEEFVQVELPKRPFVATDGTVGQVLVRSTNPLAVRELVWATITGGGGGGGGLPDPTSAGYTYTDGLLTGITELVDLLPRVSVLTYNADESINTIAVTYDGTTITATYAYDANGNITGFTTA